MSNLAINRVDRERAQQKIKDKKLHLIEEIERACRAYRNGTLDQRECWERINSANTEFKW